MCGVYCLKNKHEVFGMFQNFLIFVERQSGNQLRILRTNRGDEFLSREFNEFCSQRGIKHELIAPYSPQQNGVA